MAMPYPKNPAHFQHHLSGHSSSARAAIGELFAQRSYDCTLVAAHRAYDAGHKPPYARRHLCSCSSRRTAYKLRFGIIDWTSRNGGDFVDQARKSKDDALTRLRESTQCDSGHANQICDQAQPRHVWRVASYCVANGCESDDEDEPNAMYP